MSHKTKQTERIIELRRQGRGAKEIADMLGLSYASVRLINSRHILPQIEFHYVPIVIMSMYNRGMSKSAIIRETGISRNHLNRLIRRGSTKFRGVQNLTGESSN